MKAQKFIPLLVVAAGLLAYQNSFTGPFVFDDILSIPENQTIRHVWPIWDALSPPHAGGITVEGRPLINLSLAVNYAIGGMNVWGYHALNLAVHILAGLTLFGIVRRTLQQPRLRERFGAVADELALAAAVIWTVHPLQTESVTYVIQRAESIMGLFYLLTLYCFIRGTESRRPRAWYGLCVGACALGMASKQDMASAPLLVMLYDRAFISGSLAGGWQRRRPFYVALAGTWILLGYLMFFTGSFHNSIVITTSKGIGWWPYLLTQPGVILHYLRLAVWPRPLCFDYDGWPFVGAWTDILPQGLAVVILLGATAWALRTNSAWGILGAWFFLILAPSSSLIPSDSPAYEHRMYLPLVAVVVPGVCAIYAFFGRRSVVVFGVLAILLGCLTMRRNDDYRSGISLWSVTVATRPDNPRAHNNLADVLNAAGRVSEAIAHSEQALRLRPEFAEAHYNLGNALLASGNVQEAIGHFERALQLKPDYAEAHYNLGMALAQRGEMPAAMEQWEQTLQFKPGYAEAHNNLGIALAQLGRIPEAIDQFEQTLRIDPSYVGAHNNLGIALERSGNVPAAISQYEQVVRIQPGHAEAHYNLGAVLEHAGKRQEAVEQYEQALRLNPDFAVARAALARLQAGQ